ncbi:MAG: hypothetical protein C4K58_02020 [Flavobacteriaceae bacterium]|nr:MAG: hypothetical protein C4K58_02020 [Flavobacteriaceae bacterium]
MYGENSPYISSEDFPIIRSQFTNAQILSVSEAGHWVQADNPEEFYTKSMLFFLQNNLQS